ncbi:somatomedin-B and thrombospondin type-1 domain-containing protein-like [Falco biarmicus]|uniref:somatomedin-B and thrombospondin type-1 domain-containing protein-like n=1 Tax=Falco cherrug TaxID=345164 RepID=UPI002478A3D7|nr:somatomedin-B and thrombospondin type-1 domain-containing protein-like [Falco cherrug]XP_055670406.1 somatomedin-B and thrombospondin type-1 domain-containing protein-like isoform X1 [Falco peregrinus]XP_056210633.1 somatomedin-B and thrombospondin type-1 domain-containing protein-like [Falco biarmicus]
MAGRPPWAALLALLVLPVLPRRAAAGCAARGLCCPGRDQACRSAGWRPDGSRGPCFCDQACARTLDCCHDYARACPVIPCVVSQWSVWSGCVEPCKTTYRVRRRHIIQEPRNGGEACPPLEERAGCVEYWSQQGTECKQSLIPALITTGGFGKARKRRAAADGNERAGYCVEFQLVAITPGCLHSHHSYTHWMQYLREGHTVCVECQHPALDSRSLHCYGDGSGSKKNQLLHWQAVGNPRCRGTWKRIRQLDTCSCPSVHSFLFI